MKTLIFFNQDKAEARATSKKTKPKRRKCHALSPICVCVCANEDLLYRSSTACISCFMRNKYVFLEEGSLAEFCGLASHREIFNELGPALRDFLGCCEKFSTRSLRHTTSLSHVAMISPPSNTHVRKPAKERLERFPEIFIKSRGPEPP